MAWELKGLGLLQKWVARDGGSDIHLGQEWVGSSLGRGLCRNCCLNRRQCRTSKLDLVLRLIYGWLVELESKLLNIIALNASILLLFLDLFILR